MPSPEDVGRGPELGWLCGFFQGVSTQQEGRAGPCKGRVAVGGPLQVGFGQLGVLLRFFGLLAVAGRCVGCFALLVSPWPSCPTGRFSPLETSLLSTLLPTAGLLSNQSPAFGSTSSRSLLWRCSVGMILCEKHPPLGATSSAVGDPAALGRCCVVSWLCSTALGVCRLDF